MPNTTGTSRLGAEQQRRERLHAIARGYVTEGLGKGNFDAIPYHEHVELRAPLCPGGSALPLIGRETLRSEWWAPLPQLVAHVDVLETFVNDELSAAAVEFHLRVTTPPCELRVLDRFTINGDGEIVSQENFFDPRPLLNAATAATPTGASDMAINIQTQGVHHIALRSTDLPRARRFYIDTLGFVPVLEADGLFIFLAGATAIGVRGPDTATRTGDTFDPFRVGLDHVALACSNPRELERVAAALREAGVENTGVKRDETLGKDYVAFKDPDRISWEYYMV